MTKPHKICYLILLFFFLLKPWNAPFLAGCAHNICVYLQYLLTGYHSTTVLLSIVNMFAGYYWVRTDVKPGDSVGTFIRGWAHKFYLLFTHVIQSSQFAGAGKKCSRLLCYLSYKLNTVHPCLSNVEYLDPWLSRSLSLVYALWECAAFVYALVLHYRWAIVLWTQRWASCNTKHSLIYIYHPS
jgi:hypothetical protein